MEYCSKCFKKLCRCGKYKVEIDYYIYPAIYELNRKGYKTTSCCSGHENESHLSTYISFIEDIQEDVTSEYFQFDSYNYRGFHEKRNCIRVKSDIVKKFKKKRTNRTELVQSINRALYMWAQSLPAKVPPEDDGVEFPADYFEKEIERDEIIDLQYPWILFTKAADGCRYTVDDFFNEIEFAGEMTEFVVNRSGCIKSFCDLDYLPSPSRVGRLKEKIKFDISGDYKYLLCGYEPYALIENIHVGDAEWYLSYARTDIAAEYGDIGEQAYVDDFIAEEDTDDFTNEYSAKQTVVSKKHDYSQNLFDKDDIVDFMDDHPDATEIDLFAYMFNRLSRMNINICVFSADNINIVFSNKTDFSVLMTNEQSVFAFGEADYDYMDFPRVRVDQKEVLVYTNGRLLLRKGIE